MTDRAEETAEGTRRRAGRRAGQDDAVALTRSGHALLHLAGDIDAALPARRALVLIRTRIRLVSRRLRRGVWDGRSAVGCALHPGHAPQPARPGNVSHEGRNGGGAHVRRDRFDTALYGEQLSRTCEFPDGVAGMRHVMPGRTTEQAREAMHHCARSIRELRVANLGEWLPIRRLEHVETFITPAQGRLA